MYKLKITKSLSYANVAATLALVFAMTGGALAANSYLISSTRQISPKVLKKLKGRTGRTGAAGAKGATGATGATGASGPAGASGREGPQGKEGAAGKEGVSGVLRWRTTVAAAGTSITEPATVTLAKVGPFTVEGHCYENGTKTAAATYIATTEKGSFAQGYSGRGSESPLEAGEDLQISEDTAEGLTAEHGAIFDSPDDGSWGALTADGALSLNGFGSQAVWAQGASGPACSFSGYVVTE
jgi:hypothetical protein